MIHPSTSARFRDRGFTLIELIVAVTILGVLAAIAFPGFVDLIASQRVQTASADLQTSLTRARSEAIKQNADVTIAAVGSWPAGWIVSSASGNLEEHGATKNIAIAGPASVTYRSNGRISGGAAAQFAVSATSTSTKRWVCVSLSGQPRVDTKACT